MCQKFLHQCVFMCVCVFLMFFIMNGQLKFYLHFAFNDGHFTFFKHNFFNSLNYFALHLLRTLNLGLPIDNDIFFCLINFSFTLQFFLRGWKKGLSQEVGNHKELKDQKLKYNKKHTTYGIYLLDTYNCTYIGGLNRGVVGWFKDQRRGLLWGSRLTFTLSLNLINC